MITEHLMRLGGGSVRFRDSLPVNISNQILDLIDEDRSGVGAQFVHTALRVDATLGDAAVMAAATFAGPITDRSNRLELQFDGLGWWLDTYIETDKVFTAATPTTVLTALLINDLTVGTVSGGSNITRTYNAYSATYRDVLDAAAQAGGWEYRINPDGTVDAGTSLFQSPPTVIVTRKPEGVFGGLRGIDGGIVSQKVSVGNLKTKVAALTAGSGAAIKTGEASTTLSLRTRAGAATTLVTVANAPSEQSGNATSVATSTLNLFGLRRSLTVSTKSHMLTRHARPGDEVYIYDPHDGLVDTSNAVTFNGSIVSPIVVRKLGGNRPIDSGGVYIRPNASTPNIIDVSDWVEWENGETSWTVGTWNPPIGRVNRSNPEIEDRIAR